MQRTFYFHRFVCLWLLIMTTRAALSRQNTGNHCLSHFKGTSISPTSVKLTWNFDCDEFRSGDYKKVLYKIDYTHQKWVACPDHTPPDRKRGAGRGHTEIYDTDEFIFDNPSLYPHSEYHFDIKAIPTRKDGGRNRRKPDKSETIVITAEDIPDIAPRESTTAKPATREDKITFVWRAPQNTDCRRFNGNLHGYRYTLKGQDKWNKNSDEYTKDTNDTRAVYDGLQPGSNYMLHVFIKNENGAINKSLPLEIPATTLKLDEVDTPPMYLKIISYNESLHFSWQPPYPPTSLVQKYVFRWKDADKDRYWNNEELLRFEVVPETNSCEKLNIQSRNRDLICYRKSIATFLNKLNFPDGNADDSAVNFVMDGETEPTNHISFGNVEFHKTLLFQISAIAPNQQSENVWSESVRVALGENTLPPETGPGKVAIAVIVTLVVVFFLILIVIFIRHKCSNNERRNEDNKGPYIGVPPYESQYNGIYPRSIRTQLSVMSEASDTNASINLTQNQTPSVEFKGKLPPPEWRHQSTSYPNSRISHVSESSTMSGNTDLNDKSPKRKAPLPPQRLSYPNSRTSNEPESSTLPRNTDSNGKSAKRKDYSHIFLPLKSPNNPSPPSIQSTPLPAVPGKEPIYEELPQDGLDNDNDAILNSNPLQQSQLNTNPQHYLNQPGAIKVTPNRKKSEGFESDEDFLEPRDVSLKNKDGGESDDNDYLAPTTREKRPNDIDNLFRKSCSDIDNTNGDTYLKPTFNQFDRINSRDLSPPHEKPPPIPMQSYSTGKERVIPIKVEK